MSKLNLQLHFFSVYQGHSLPVWLNPQIPSSSGVINPIYYLSRSDLKVFKLWVMCILAWINSMLSVVSCIHNYMPLLVTYKLQASAALTFQIWEMYVMFWTKIWGDVWCLLAKEKRKREKKEVSAWAYCPIFSANWRLQLATHKILLFSWRSLTLLIVKTWCSHKVFLMSTTFF
jgi:hypothetical protein